MKAPIQPLCRYCGAPIRKQTHTVIFGRSVERRDDYSTSLTQRPRSLEEAQRLVNQQIVSVRWARGDELGAARTGGDYIHQVTTWDGASYVDLLFCNGGHARLFAYAAARNGHVMPAYLDARAKILRKERS